MISEFDVLERSLTFDNKIDLTVGPKSAKRLPPGLGPDHGGSIMALGPPAVVSISQGGTNECTSSGARRALGRGRQPPPPIRGVPAIQVEDLPDAVEGEEEGGGS